MLVRAEVGVRDHPQWFPTLLLEMGVPQSSLEFADMASFTSHFGWGECWRRLELQVGSGDWNYGLTFAGQPFDYPIGLVIHPV